MPHGSNHEVASKTKDFEVSNNREAYKVKEILEGNP
jgi:hypothetical protein